MILEEKHMGEITASPQAVYAAMKEIHPLSPAYAFVLMPKSMKFWSGEFGLAVMAEPKAEIQHLWAALQQMPKTVDAHMYTGTANGCTLQRLTTRLEQLGCPAAVGMSMGFDVPVWFTYYKDAHAYERLRKIALAQIGATVRTGRMPSA